MTFSHAKGLLVIALIASVGGKLLVYHPMAELQQRDTQGFLFSALTKEGFKEVTGKEMPNEVILVQRSDCTIALIDYAPHGTFKPYYEELSGGIGDLRYLYRGSYYLEPPKFYPLLEFYLSRELNRISINWKRSPIIATAASEACGHHSSRA